MACDSARISDNERRYCLRAPNASHFHNASRMDTDGMEHFSFPGAHRKFEILPALRNECHLRILQYARMPGYSLWSNLAGEFAAVIANSELLFLHFTTTLTHT